MTTLLIYNKLIFYSNCTKLSYFNLFLRQKLSLSFKNKFGLLYEKLSLSQRDM